MSTFYEKYKKMRLDQKIDLTDIENRTKINIKYLEAIESGNFKAVQQPYLRLFLKAYVNEIGADPAVALSELSEFLLKNESGKPNSKPIEEQKKIIKEVAEKVVEEEMAETTKIKDISKEIKSSNSKIVPPNYIRGIIFIAVWIVALLIIRNITLDSDVGDEQIAQSSIMETYSNYVDFAQLQVDYTETSSQQNALEVTPPFIVKIVTNDMLGIVVQQDTLNIESIPVAGGNQHTFTYENKLDLVLNHSNGISAFINGEPINDIRELGSPARLQFSTEPNSVSIIHYKLTQ
jgi:hypothetical protein